MRFFVPLCAFVICLHAHAEEQDQEDGKVHYKLTLADYSAQQLHAQDVNLRARFGNQTLWLGYYTDHDFQQTRTGYERIDEGSWYKVTSSLQAATHDFLGAAVTAELGGKLHGIVGYGRTNLKPYDNINFDPNDSITYGAGLEWAEDEDISVYRVRDDRVVKGQQIDHVLLHLPGAGGDKAIVDLFSKSGSRDADGKSIAGTGAALTYEWPCYFVRLAYDPKVNFTQAYMTRLSFGFFF